MSPQPTGTIDHRDIRAALAGLAVPAFASTIGDQLLGVADTIAIGTLGAPSLAAVTGATTVFVAIVLAVHGLSQGAGILAAQAVGAGDHDRFGRIVRASLPVPLALSLALAGAAVFFARPGMHALLAPLLGPSSKVDAGAWYLALRCFSIVPVCISGLVYTAFAAAGDTRFGVKLLILINAIHIPLLLILALGVGTHRPLGISGAGISSLCAETLGAGYSIAAAWRRPHLRVFAGREFDLRLGLRIFALGLPEAVYLFLIVAPDVAIVAILAAHGPDIVAAFRVLALVSDLTWSVPGSLGSAAQTIIGQRFGADDGAGARLFERGALRYGVALSAGTGAAVAVLAWPLAFACTLNAPVASLAAAPLAIHMLTLRSRATR